MDVNQKELHELEGLCTQEQPPSVMAACPLHISCREICRCLATGDFDGARALYEKTALFPELLCRLCGEPCQSSCPREECGGSVHMRALEEAAVRFGAVKEKRLFLPKKTQRAVVVGAGVAGLAAALELGKKGYQTVVLEKSDRVWGWIREDPRISEEHCQTAFQRLEKYPVEVCLRQSAADPVKLAEEYDVVIVAWGKDNLCLQADPETFETDDPGIFACGQAVEGGNAGFAECLAAGRRAAISADRFLKQVSMTAGREQEGSFVSTLHVVTEQETPHASQQTDRSRVLTREEAMAEAARCLDCKCTDCIEACAFMRYYKGYPKKYLREIYNNLSIAMGTRHANKMINSCSLCGQCGVICPHGLDMAPVIKKARQIMVSKKKMPPSAFEFALNDLKYSNSPEVFLARGQNEGDCAYAFFPGCQLSASAPVAVEKAYQDLRSRLAGGVGLILGCCGVMADWAGETVLFQESVEQIKEAWEQLGRPVMIMACPMCLKVLREQVSSMRCLGVWEVMLEIGLPKGCAVWEGQGLVHDPCGARGQEEICEQVRILAAQLGFALAEGSYSRGQTGCCGYGGLTAVSNPTVADAMTEQCLKDGAELYLTYCINCRERLVKGGGIAAHILELIYDGREAVRRADPSYSLRQDNRLLLKQRLLERFWEEPMEVKERIPIRYDRAVAEMLEERKILESDIRAVLERAQEGYCLREVKSGMLIAHRQVGNVTFWIYYRQAEDGVYEIVRAYAHRMTISKEGEF